MQTAALLETHRENGSGAQSRVTVLQSLIDELKSFSDESDREAFTRLFSRAQILLELEDLISQRF